MGSRTNFAEAIVAQRTRPFDGYVPNVSVNRDDAPSGALYWIMGSTALTLGLSVTGLLTILA